MGNKMMKLFCCIAVVAAMILICALFLHYRNLGVQLRNTESLLAASRNAWESTAAEKESLQENRKNLENDLKEAKLSLKEAQEKTVELKEDIETLTREIDELKSRVP